MKHCNFNWKIFGISVISQILVGCTTVGSIVKSDEMSDYFSRGRYIEAEEAAKIYISQLDKEAQPKNSIAYLRGLSFINNLYFFQGRYSDAYLVTNKMIEIMDCDKNPMFGCSINHHKALLSRATLSLKLGKNREAAGKDLINAIKNYDNLFSSFKNVGPESTLYYMALADYYFEAKKYSEAIDAANSAQKGLGFFGNLGAERSVINNSILTHLRASAFLELGKNELALKELRKINEAEIEGNPALFLTRVRHFTLLARYSASNHAWEDALKSSRKAIGAIFLETGNKDFRDLPLVMHSTIARNAFDIFLESASNLPKDGKLNEEIFAVYQMAKNSALNSAFVAKTDYRATDEGYISKVKELESLRSQLETLDYRIANMRVNNARSELQISAAQSRLTLFQRVTL